MSMKTYSDVPRSAFEKLRAGLERAQVSLPPGDSGAFASKGIEGTFRYDAGAAALELEISKHPIFIPEKMLWAGIDGAVADAQRA